MLEWCDEHIHNTEVLNLMKVSKQIFKDRSSKKQTEEHLQIYNIPELIYEM